MADRFRCCAGRRSDPVLRQGRTVRPLATGPRPHRHIEAGGGTILREYLLDHPEIEPFTIYEISDGQPKVFAVE
jgi:hypothetical protein